MHVAWFDDAGGQFLFGVASTYTGYPAPDTIWLDQVVCTGSEASLSACAANAWGDTDCSHDEDVSVRCDRATHGLITAFISCLQGKPL
jgi:hypothetical protein